jgi:hypothetical protein
MHAPAQALARPEASTKATSTHAPEPGASSAASTRGPGSLVGGTRSAPPMGPPADGPKPAALAADTELTQVPIGLVQPGLQMKVPAASDAEMMRQRGGPVESIGASRPTLELGSFGPDVQALQRALMAAGAHLVPDGMFGRETQDALVAFQRQAGIAATGAAGPEVWSVIDLHQGAASGGMDAPSLVPAGPGQAKADPGRSGGGSGGGGGSSGSGSGPSTPAEDEAAGGATGGALGAATAAAGGAAAGAIEASGGPLKLTETGTGTGAIIEARTALEGGPAAEEGGAAADSDTDPLRGGGGSGGTGGGAGAAGGAGGAGGSGGAGAAGAAGGAGGTSGAGATSGGPGGAAGATGGAAGGSGGGPGGADPTAAAGAALDGLSGGAGGAGGSSSSTSGGAGGSSSSSTTSGGSGGAGGSSSSATSSGGAGGAGGAPSSATSEGAGGGGGGGEVATGGPGAGAAPERTGEEGAPGADPAKPAGVEELLRTVEGLGGGGVIAALPEGAMAAADGLAAMFLSGMEAAPAEEAPETEAAPAEEAPTAAPVTGAPPAFVAPVIGEGGGPGTEVSTLVEDAKTRSSALISGFMSGAEAKAAEVLGAGGALRDRVLGAALTAKALVEDNRAAQKAAVIAQFQASRTAARGKATGLLGQLDADFGALVANIEARNTTFGASVDVAAAASKVKVAAMGAAQMVKISGLYTSAAAQYKAAGGAAAQQAQALAEAEAKSYEARVTGKMDSWTDGYLTDRRWKARAKAARAVGKEYAKGLRAKAEEIAGKSWANLPNDLNGVVLAINNANDLINSQAKAVKDAANANKTAAVAAANDQKKALKKAVNEARAAAVGALEQEEAEHLANIDQAANDALTGIDSQAEGLAAGAEAALAQGAVGIRAAAAQLQASLNGKTAPDPDQLAPALSEAQAALDGQVEALMAQVNAGVSQGEAGLLEAGGKIAAALGEAGAAAVGRGQAAVSAFDESLGKLRTNAAQAVRSVRDGYTKGQTKLEAARDGAFKPVEDNISALFADFLSRMAKGAVDNAAALKAGLVEAAKGDMMKAIREEAKKAADAEQPAWKSVVAWVLIIAVIVVVAVFAGPLIIGACVGAAGALGAGAVAATIIGTAVGGAIVGALSSGAIQIISNFRDGKAWNDGLGTAMVMGAVTGLLTGGFGGWLSSGARLAYGPVLKAVLQGAFDIVLNTAVAAFKGELDWSNFGFIVLQSVVANGVDKMPKIKDMSAGAKAGIKFGGDVAVEGTKQYVTKGELNFNDMAMATVSSAANNFGGLGRGGELQQDAFKTGQDFGASSMTGLRNGMSRLGGGAGDQPVTGGSGRGDVSDLLAKGDIQGVSRLTGMDPVEVEVLMLYKNEAPGQQFKSLAEIDAIQPGLGTKLGALDAGPFRPVLDAVNGGDKALIQKLTKLDSESVDILLLYRDQEPGGRFANLADLDKINAGLGGELGKLEPGGPALPSASIQSAPGGEDKDAKAREAGAFIDKDEQDALSAPISAGPAAGAGQ